MHGRHQRARTGAGRQVGGRDGAPPRARGRPFATGPNQFKVPIAAPEQAWDKVFKGFSATDDTAAKDAQRATLRARRSVLDDLTQELKRFRTELSGIEKLKLDMHEDAIRSAELSVAADLEANGAPPGAQCVVLDRDAPGNDVPARAQAHFDLMFAAFACERVQVGGMMWGFSGYHWRYEWVPGVSTDTIHDSVHHKASAERDTYIKACRWDFDQLGRFVRRLKDTPEGSGSMLDNTLVVAISHFGQHHRMENIPVVLFGSAAGGLKTGRYLDLPSSVHNDKVLTSVAHLMGDPLPGFGNDPGCGPLAQLHV